MSVEAEPSALEGQPAAGEKRSIVPGGKVQTIRPPRKVKPHVGRSRVVGEKLRQMAAAKEAKADGTEVEQGTAAGATEGATEGGGQVQASGRDPGAGGGEATEGTERVAVREEPEGGEGTPEAGGGKDLAEAEAKGDAGDSAKKPTRDLSAQFSALARAEKRFREERQAWQEEQRKAEEEYKSLRELKAVAERDKYQLLDHLGVDVEDWAAKTLGKKKAAEEQPEHVQKLVERLDALEQRNQELEEQQQTAAKQAEYQAFKEQQVAEIDALLQNDKERWELTAIEGGGAVVFATIEEHFYRTGVVKTFEEAADEAEAFFDGRAERYSKAQKFQRRLAPQGAPAGASKASSSGGVQEESRPRKIVTSAADRVSASGLTKKERRERAIAVLKAGRQ